MLIKYTCDFFGRYALKNTLEIATTRLVQPTCTCKLLFNMVKPACLGEGGEPLSNFSQPRK